VKLKVEFTFVHGFVFEDITSEFASANALMAQLTKAINSPGGTIKWQSYDDEHYLIVAANVVTVKITQVVTA
jgi:hypothetical protein